MFHYNFIFQSSPPKAKKKRLSKSYDEENFEDGLKLIALGTTAGTVNLYSFAKGLLHTELVRNVFLIQLLFHLSYLN